MNRFFYSILFVMILGCVGVFFEVPLSGLRFTFCDVGQGDAVLVSKGSWQMLIDTGPDEMVLSCLEKALPFWDKKIELVVLTHPDSDHIGGFLSLARVYQIGALCTLPRNPDTQLAQKVLEETNRLSRDGTKIHVPLHQKVFIADTEVKIEVINPFFPASLGEECLIELSETYLWDKNNCFMPQKKWAEINKNNLSIGIKLTIDEVVIFLSGDLEKEAELALLAEQTLQDIDLLKVGHHGSKSSTTREILEVLRPEISVISVGKNNAYSHPSSQVLHQLEEIGSQVFRTDTQGTVEFLLKEGIFLHI